jgi:Family of unknown function (DUF6152)
MRLGFVLLFAAMPLAAHHGSAEFDDSKVVAMQGVVTVVQWMNPHAQFFIDVIGADGKVVNWEIVMAPPNTLGRQGLKKDTFKTGDRIVLDVWLAKTSGLHRAAMRTLTLPDSRVLLGIRGWDNPTKIQ